MSAWRDDPVHCGRLSPDPLSDGLEVRADGTAYCKTHRLLGLIDELAGAGPVTLVTGASDASANGMTAAMLPPNVRAWFSTNAASHRVRPLPIGFVWSETRMAAMEGAARIPRRPRNTLFVCHTARPQNPDREALLGRFSGCRWATVAGGKSPHDLPPHAFYQELRRHAYVLAPEGAGPDTHRLWEALAMGCVPVALRSPVHRQWEHLPVLWVDSWEEVEIGLLADRLPALQAALAGPLPELTWSHWQGKIAATCA